MQELIIIRTNNSGKVKKVLKQERINFEIYQEGESSTKKISDKDLGKAYQEA
jgi:hypothetical protein